MLRRFAIPSARTAGKFRCLTCGAYPTLRNTTARVALRYRDGDSRRLARAGRNVRHIVRALVRLEQDSNRRLGEFIARTADYIGNKAKHWTAKVFPAFVAMLGSMFLRRRPLLLLRERL
ncbi:hypothetical protein GCM10023318_31050 [Nocardia callitridis]|uniref:Transposase n=1 Tax=Nocardia callitridis TaxID=648753 RepID=A0ABP9KBA0_9NOCA